MKTCGIEIKGKEAIFVVLNSEDGDITDKTGEFKKLALVDDENPDNVQRFYETFAAHMDSVNADQVALLKRNKSGNFASGALSFKLEGVLQMYKRKPVELVSPATVRAYKKRTKFTGSLQYKYQQPAYELANYLQNR